MYGLGPRGVDFGDTICILFGCSVSVVLRHVLRYDTTLKPSYRLIGERFVYERMDGEAIAGQDISVLRSKTKEFYIR